MVFKVFPNTDHKMNCEDISWPLRMLRVGQVGSGEKCFLEDGNCVSRGLEEAQSLKLLYSHIQNFIPLVFSEHVVEGFFTACRGPISGIAVTLRSSTRVFQNFVNN